MLNKQAIDVSFAEGLDTKTDPKRVQIGKFLELENTVFNKGGLLQKRNGYASLTALPDSTYSYLTTFNGNLTALGNNVAAFNSKNGTWIQKGAIQPVEVATLPLLRNNLNQTMCDSVIAANGLICTVYLETTGSVVTAKYVVADSVTGQNIVAPAPIPVGSGTVTGGLRVFYLGTNFVIVFTNVITAVSHLQYVTVNSNVPTNVGANTDIAAAYIPATTLAWDGYVVGTKLFLAYNTTSGGQSIKVTYLNTAGILANPTTFAGYTATMMSVTADVTNAASPTIYISFYNLGSTTGFTASVDSNLNILMAPVLIIPSGTALNITSAAQDGTCTVFYEVSNNYSYDAAIPTHFIRKVSITPAEATFQSVFLAAAGFITASNSWGDATSGVLVDNTTPSNITAGTTFASLGLGITLFTPTAGPSAGSPGDTLAVVTLSATTVVIRSVGLASKAFIIDGVIYFLSAYQSPFQPTYFLINGSTSVSSSPVMVGKLAYENGGGYLTTGLPSVSVDDLTAQLSYLFKDLIQSVNKDTNVVSGTQINGIYSQTGINLVRFTIGTHGLDTSEVGGDLHISGGFLWMYDGYLPVEHNFVLWPDTDTTTPTDFASWSATGGSIVAQPNGSTNASAYYYQVTYEWTDNQGNAFRSAPSIPIAVTTTGAGSAGSITLNIPTLRLTMKTANPVKIVIYRWSVGQQNYYQTTSITSPLLNSTTVDSVTFLDTNSDATILGNNLLYTTGGVVEDVNAPASNILTLFDSRLWLVDAEDPNLLWYSKQVIENTPVEMSDLFTIFVPPTVSTQSSTGPITALASLDDKLIIFKENAIYYINGTGPDNTGANNQYSPATFITGTVGCALQRSIVLMPMGLMFQSDKGIWILGRDLQTNYIGAPVEAFTLTGQVNSAVGIPATNQVRFTLDSGVTLMYDYFYGQWGTFTGVPALSSCIFEDMHAFINEVGSVYQERPNYYQDGSNPVLISFKTSFLRLGDLQNYQRAYFFYLLGTFLSPHKLYINLTYDYEDSPTQSIIVSPINYGTPYGSGVSQSPYGQGDPYGGPSNLENWRVFLQRQRCMAFAISLQEIFDPEFGTTSGAGFTLSGLNVVMGFKQKFRPQDAQTSVG